MREYSSEGYQNALNQFDPKKVQEVVNDTVLCGPEITIPAMQYEGDETGVIIAQTVFPEQ